jgi:Na+-transporting NADH:ubiquinone oxidoreductase subunit NqrC
VRRARPWIRWLNPPAIVLSTLGPCFAETYLSIEEAQASLFPGESLEASTVVLTQEQVKAIQDAAGVRVRDKTLTLWRSQAGGILILDRVLGKHEYITWALALNEDGSVKGLEILEYRETYGYQVREEKWRAQFRGKRHGAPLKLDQDIHNITGATLSCSHIADGVRRLLATYELALRK